MGKAIEKIAISKKYKIHSIVNSKRDLKKIDLSTADIGIEFTNPKSAFENISFCLKSNLPVVSGSTGWLAELKTVEKICEKYDGSFLHSSNFSLSMNNFLNISKRLAKNLKNYDISILEKHHIQKLDKPSGTAILLKNEIQKYYKKDINIVSSREKDVKGVHTVFYKSPYDVIEITHSAKNRDTFANGAIMSAEWLVGKKGFYNFNDCLKNEK
jgi:4-hydroxy-tetrahydrodipicolinate reductase